MMARDESIWGKDAKQFKPSRWVNDEGELVKETQWKAHMFNGGYRLCLGAFSDLCFREGPVRGIRRLRL